MSAANEEYPRRTGSAFPPVLDACCGGRMMWFNKADPRCLYVDKRCESFHVGPGPRDFYHVQPDQVCDFSALPFPDNTFAHVVFDPPHLVRQEPKGWMTRKYGVLNGDWREMLRKGFAECFRVLRPDGVLVFKWSDGNVKVREILALTPVLPLYGHKTTQHTNTHWIAFLKPNVRAVLLATRCGSPVSTSPLLAVH